MALSRKSRGFPEEASTRRNADSLSSERLHRRPPATEAERLQESYQIPSLHLASTSMPPSRKDIPTSLRHKRSVSHRFPSLFQSKQNRQRLISPAPLRFTDDDAQSSDVQQPLMIKPKILARVTDNALVTGKCMTCNSTVRWPKELSIFRCAVCITINDLKPAALPPHRGDKQTLVSTFAKCGTQSSSRVDTLSAARIGLLAEECIIAYLLGRISHTKDGKGGEKTLPLMSCRQETASIGGMALKKECLAPPRLAQRNYSLGTSIDNLEKDHARPAQPTESDGSPKYRMHSKHQGPSPHRTRMDRFPDIDLTSPEKLESAHNEGWMSPNLQSEVARNIFKQLEEYIVKSFMSRECINSSFVTSRTPIEHRSNSDGTGPTADVPRDGIPYQSVGKPSKINASTLLNGDSAENDSRWAGHRSFGRILDRSCIHGRYTSTESSSSGLEVISPRSSRIDWEELTEWYHGAIYPSHGWKRHLSSLLDYSGIDGVCEELSAKDIEEMDNEIRAAQAHTQHVLLKATESLLKRPGGQLKDPEDVRFLLIILANPLLYPSYSSTKKTGKGSRPGSGELHYQKTLETTEILQPLGSLSSRYSEDQSSGPGKHSGIIKRVLGLLSNLPNNCHHHLVACFSRYPSSQFPRTTELVSSFVTYRLSRLDEKRLRASQGSTTGPVPVLTVAGHRGLAAQQTSLGGQIQHSKQSDIKSRGVLYDDDWQIKAAAKVMALLFSANFTSATWKSDVRLSISKINSDNGGLTNDDRVRRHRQILPTNSFYNTLLDYSDLIADFEAWEGRRVKFAFCQYPFFLSIWAKIQIMEHDAHRQMEVKAREAFFDSIMTRKAVNQYLILRIRRACLVEDSLRGVSEVVGSGEGEIKKSLRIEFRGEDGIDAGGLRKEWFLLLVRDLFNPEHGMFTYDDDSKFCYFNPYSFETSDQFFLVGVVLGLAIYNSTILDIALPSFAFRKLLAAGPYAAPGAVSHGRPPMTYSLDDLAEVKPTLANGLQQLLQFDGDVESTFCRDFVADVERYGQNIQVPICPNGDKTPVTNANRREFVDQYVRYLLDTAVTRQFEPFKRGFFSVCGGNALSLFRAEEIELLIRGSDDPLDITTLRAVAVYENWVTQNPAEAEPVIGWFWKSFERANSDDQRKLLSFITGSDRIPAMGTANLVIKLSCLGEDSPRFPVARTCFNMLSLWRYGSQYKLETMLWRAVHDSEGFGLK